MTCTHCSRMMASWACLMRLLSSKSTPSKVGGTVGFLARKASDSGVGIASCCGSGRECNRLAAG